MQFMAIGRNVGNIGSPRPLEIAVLRVKADDNGIANDRHLAEMKAFRGTVKITRHGIDSARTGDTIRNDLVRYWFDSKRNPMRPPMQLPVID